MQEHKPLTQFVYENLYADVINGVLTPNDILSENALTERFSVSKSPVREALVSLCDDGVLRSIPRVGYKVVQITPAEVRHLEEARCALETFMLRRSFPSIGQREIVLLRQHVTALLNTGPPASRYEAWRRNSGFHLQLASYSGNPYMCGLLDRTLRNCAQAAGQHFSGEHADRNMDGRNHIRLIAALEARDLPLALSLLEQDARQIGSELQFP
ncbi:MAG: GntR family transcriptional regulator [Clostridia bacterium]|nr:GntR family transcriptional regulator [Clostridia bacterium]